MAVSFITTVSRAATPVRALVWPEGDEDPIVIIPRFCRLKTPHLFPYA
jgi:hypothetical protein